MVLGQLCTSAERTWPSVGRRGQQNALFVMLVGHTKQFEIHRSQSFANFDGFSVLKSCSGAQPSVGQHKWGSQSFMRTYMYHLRIWKISYKCICSDSSVFFFVHKYVHAQNMLLSILNNVWERIQLAMFTSKYLHAQNSLECFRADWVTCTLT